jgi:GAF domain-containing protein
MLHDNLNILFLGDETIVPLEIRQYFQNTYNDRFSYAESYEKAMEMLGNTRCDVVLLDESRLDGGNGLDVCKSIKAVYPKLEIVLLTRHETQPSLKVIQAGTHRYVLESIESRLVEAILQSAIEEANLQRICDEITQSNDLSEVLRLTCKAAVELTGVEHSGIVEFKPDLSQGRAIAEYPDRSFFGIKETIAIPVKGMLAEERLVHHTEILNIPDVGSYDDLGEVKSILQTYRIESILIVPIVVNGKVTHSFSLDSIGQKRTFSVNDVELCRRLATQASVAIQNAQLHRAWKVAEEAAQLTLGDTHSFLDSVLAGIKKVVDFDAATLYAVNEDTGELDHPPALLGIRNTDSILKTGETLKNVDTGQTTTQSIVYTMLTRNEPYIVENTSQDPLFKDLRFVRDEEIKSSAVFPLKTGQQQVGIMFINYRTPHHFTQDELDYIKLYANRMMQGIRYAQLYKHTKERATLLDISYQVSQTIVGGLTLSDTLNQIALHGLRIVQPEQKQVHCCCYISLLEGQILKHHAANSDEVLQELRMRIGDRDINDKRPGIAGRAAKNEEIQNVGDVKHNNDFVEFRPDTQSQLSVPLKIERQIIGVITIEHPDKHAFGKKEENALRNLAGQAAVAINNAQLHQRDKILYESSQRINAAAELDKIGNAILKELHELIGYDKATIQLIQGDSRQLLAYRGFSPNLINPNLLRNVSQDNLIKDIVDRKRIKILEDLSKRQKHPTWDYTLEETKDVKSWVGIPLVYAGEVIALVTLDHKDARAYREADTEQMALLERLAQQSAYVLKQALLLQDAQYGQRQIVSLLEASNILISSQTPEQILFDLVNLTLNAAKAMWVSVVLINEDEKPYKVITHGEYKDKYNIQDVVRKPGSSLSIRVMRGMKALPIENVDNQTDGFVNEVVRKENVKAALCLPLTSRGKRLGVIWIHYDHPKSFPEADVNALQLYANQAGSAYDSALRMMELQRVADNFAGEIREYYKDAQNQSRRNAIVALGVAAIGVFIFFISFGLVLFVQSNPSILGVISGVIIQIISLLFFRRVDVANKRMDNCYHDLLQFRRFENLLAASSEFSSAELQNANRESIIKAASETWLSPTKPTERREPRSV